MDSFEFDNVKAEKEDALWRYNMERKLRICIRLIGILMVLFFLILFWFPSLIDETVAIAGDYHRRFISTFNNSLFTFVILNIIIVVVYVLSDQKQTQKHNTYNHDIYDDYVSSHRNLPTPAVAVTTADSTTSEEETLVDKQIVLVENAVAVSPVEVTETKTPLSPVKQKKQQQQQQQQQRKMTIQTVTKTKQDGSSSTNEQNDDEMKQNDYRRSRTMISESRRNPREFRRSETAMTSRELVMASDKESPRKSMDEMSNEEFRLKIDSFIAERKKIFMQENTAAHITRRKEKYCMSIMVKN